jgi:hypothetical protein
MMALPEMESQPWFYQHAINLQLPSGVSVRTEHMPTKLAEDTSRCPDGLLVNIQLWRLAWKITIGNHCTARFSIPPLWVGDYRRDVREIRKRLGLPERGHSGALLVSGGMKFHREDHPRFGKKDCVRLETKDGTCISLAVYSTVNVRNMPNIVYLYADEVASRRGCFPLGSRPVVV